MGSRQVLLELPWCSPPLSLNDRGSSRLASILRTKQIGEIRAQVAVLGKAAKLPTGVPFATITLHYRPRDNRPRDTVNLAPTLKAAVDGLCPLKVVKTKRGYNTHAGCGFLIDDSTRHVSTPEPVIHPAEKGKPGAMWLEISYQLAISN